MKKKTFLAGMLMVFYIGSGIAQQPSTVKVDDGLLQGTSEDGLTVYRGILYLNIWTPAKFAGDHIPLLFWIYSGGFGGGATSEKNYSGENLAKKGVVLVSIAYRVGQLGFFAHPELNKESPNHVSGNYGPLDMIAGLYWVQGTLFLGSV